MKGITPRWNRYSIYACLIALGLALVLAVSLRTVAFAQDESWPPFVWPISGTSTPDLPQSDTYGPRLRATCGRCYDYHQGIDIPAPVSTTLVAVLTGTVRIAGSHPGYSDGVVQLNHGNDLYTNYLHVSASLVVTDQVVAQGEAVALSGASSSGFAHLHFETRQGSVQRQDAVNPYRYLPYTDTLRHTIAITEVLADGSVWLRVTAPADELDLNTVTLTVRSAITGGLLAAPVLDYEARNKNYLGDPTQIDIPDLDGVLIQPLIYTSSTPLYVVDFLFHSLPGLGSLRIHACALDVKGNAACAKAAGVFGRQLFLPQITQNE